MAQFRTTADIMDLALDNGGEVTNGNSSYEARVLGFLNRVHHAIISGGTISIGKDATVQIDETWPWAKSRNPIVIELQPAYTQGNITVSRGSDSVTFYPAPSISLEGYHLQIPGREEVFKIAAHTADETTAYIDSAYPDESVTQVAFVAFKIDYNLIPAHLIVTDMNNKIQFQKTAGVTLTGTLTKGVYSPSELATHVASVMTTAAGGPTITGSFSSISGKFSLVSDGAGSTTLIIVGDGNLSATSIHHTLGFDDATSTAGLTQTSTYVLGGISRLVEPFKIHKGAGVNVTSVDPETLARNYPLRGTPKGNPDRFAVLRETADGLFTVRFNKYPDVRTRIEADFVPVPHDLKDSDSSIPLVPRKHIDVLEDAATFYLMLLKSDDRMPVYANLVQGKLNEMIASHRGQLVRTGKFFGQIIPRREKLHRNRPMLAQTPYSEPAAVSGTVQTLIQETLSYGDFSVAGLTKTVTVHTLAANRTLFSILIKHNQAFAGGLISAVSLNVGILADDDKFITSFDVFQAVSADAQDSTLTVYYPGVATAITVTATAVGANLNALTAGSVDLFFLESIVG